MFLWFLFAVSRLFALPTEEALTALYIDFDESMHQGYSLNEYNTALHKKPQKAYLSFVKHLYEKNHFLTKLHDEPIHAIPRIIHQIWLGSPLPERYRQFQETWKKFHPDWEYRLWTDADVEPFQMINRKAFDESANYGERSNIFRYEILDRFGGLYVDTDFECLQSFDLPHSFYEFYSGMATINRITLINNGLIASIPNHPILKACIAKINKKNYGFKQFGRNGTIYFGHMIVETCMNDKSVDLSKVLIMPPTYCYPWEGEIRGKTVEESILPSSFAVHYWDSSWKDQHLNGR